MDSVLLGMSGGIDSSVSALLLKTHGYHVIGIWLAVNNIEESQAEHLKKLETILGIQIRFLNKTAEFEETIISYFRKEHLSGRSPSPCAVCNPLFKWKILLEYADMYKIPFVATGHYIQKIFWQNKWWLKKGADTLKDQSYFLWGLNQETISRMILPLGTLTKTETKEIGRQNGLEFLLNQKESMGLCFAGDTPYGELIQKNIPEIAFPGPGNIVDIEGKIIGRHKGYLFYTIGQKREMEFYDGIIRSVAGIDAQRNSLIAAPESELWQTSFHISDYHFIDEEFVLNSPEVSVKIRGIGRNPKGNAKLTKLPDGHIRVETEEPVWAVAPGQPAVFYFNNLLAGGGIVD